MALRHTMFIAIEAADGVGKTSTALELVQCFKDAGYDAKYFREPGGTVVGEHIRSLVLDPAAEITANAQMMLMLASRFQLFEQEIIPFAEGASEDNKRVVICDRFFLSTQVYQVLLQGASMAIYNSILEKFTTPDYLVLLHCDYEVAKERQLASGRDINKFDLENEKTKKLIHDYYAGFVRDFQNRGKMPQYYTKNYLVYDTAEDGITAAEIADLIYHETSKDYWKNKGE